MKHLNEYLLSKLKKELPSSWQEILDFAKSNDQDTIDFSETLSKCLDKLGHCPLNDILITGIMNVLYTDEYTLILNSNLSHDHFPMTQKYVTIEAGLDSDWISLEIYNPNSDKVKLIHVESYERNNFDKFSLYFVENMNKENFIEAYKKGILTGGDNDKNGISFTISKNHEDSEGIKKLEENFKKILE